MSGGQCQLTLTQCHLMAQFSLYVHKSDLKPNSFHFHIFKQSNDGMPLGCFPHYRRLLFTDGGEGYPNNNDN